MLSCPPECAQVFFCPFAFPHFLSSFASKLPLAEPARSHKWSVTADTVVGFYVLRVAQPVEPHQTTPAARRNHGSQESRPCRRFTPALSAIRKLATNASAVSDAPHGRWAGRFGKVPGGACDTAV